MWSEFREQLALAIVKMAKENHDNVYFFISFEDEELGFGHGKHMFLEHRQSINSDGTNKEE